MMKKVTRDKNWIAIGGDLAHPQRSGARQAEKRESREENIQDRRVCGSKRGKAVRQNVRCVGGAGFCGANIAVRSARWAVTGQLGLHGKCECQQA